MIHLDFIINNKFRKSRLFLFQNQIWGHHNWQNNRIQFWVSKNFTLWITQEDPDDQLCANESRSNLNKNVYQYRGSYGLDVKKPTKPADYPKRTDKNSSHMGHGNNLTTIRRIFVHFLEKTLYYKDQSSGRSPVNSTGRRLQSSPNCNSSSCPNGTADFWENTNF